MKYTQILGTNYFSIPSKDHYDIISRNELDQLKSLHNKVKHSYWRMTLNIFLICCFFPASIFINILVLLRHVNASGFVYPLVLFAFMVSLPTVFSPLSDATKDTDVDKVVKAKEQERNIKKFSLIDVTALANAGMSSEAIEKILKDDTMTKLFFKEEASRLEWMMNSKAPMTGLNDFIMNSSLATLHDHREVSAAVGRTVTETKKSSPDAEEIQNIARTLDPMFR